MSSNNGKRGQFEMHCMKKTRFSAMSLPCHNFMPVSQYLGRRRRAILFIYLSICLAFFLFLLLPNGGHT